MIESKLEKSSHRIKCRFHNITLNSLGDAKKILFSNETIVVLNNYDGSECSPSIVTKASVFHNENFLYAGFTAKYEKINSHKDSNKNLKNGKTHLLWQLEDVVELFIGPEAKQKKEYKEFQVSPFSNKIDINIKFKSEKPEADFDWNSGFNACSWIDDSNKIWYSIFEIPFVAFSRIPINGEKWYCNFYRCSPDMKILLSWSPVYKPAFHQPERFGVIEFVK